MRVRRHMSPAFLGWLKTCGGGRSSHVHAGQDSSPTNATTAGTGRRKSGMHSWMDGSSRSERRKVRAPGSPNPQQSESPRSPAVDPQSLTVSLRIVDCNHRGSLRHPITFVDSNPEIGIPIGKFLARRRTSGNEHCTRPPIVRALWNTPTAAPTSISEISEFSREDALSKNAG